MAKWAFALVGGLLAVVIGLGTYIWRDASTKTAAQSALWATQFGQWADTLAEVNRTVDERADSLQNQLAEIALEQSAQINEIVVMQTRIEGKLALIEERKNEMERRALQHEGRPWHDGAGEALGNQGLSVQRLQDRLRVLEEETEKRLDIHMDRITRTEQQRDADHQSPR